MKAHFTIGLMTLALILITPCLQAGEGKAVYENNCTRCHGTDVFTRDDRNIKSLDGLKNRVAQCNNAVEKDLSDEEIKSVTDYLNRSFYKF